MTYAEQLKDPRWQQLRLRVFERDGWRCQFCDATDRTLHAHHRFYERGAKPWETNESFLVTLCEQCHELATKRLARLRILAGCQGAAGLKLLLDFAERLEVVTGQIVGNSSLPGEIAFALEQTVAGLRAEGYDR